MTLAAVLVLAALAAAGAWWWSHRASNRNAPPRATRAPKPFAAVEIRLRGTACEAARNLEGQRYLSSEAPALPLAGCTAGRCTCSFVKLSDRRADDRRSELGGLTSSLFRTAERRTRAGRREVD